ncbi:MAG TPA: SET domain-containing protein-lysine N-methyltransferase [Pseudomonadota bacterium]|nr:SET domain-containing protein-lysine N-methyltransferase [Pseudomonadota bacterium]
MSDAIEAMTDAEMDALIAENQHHPNVVWRRIPGKGRGVFARRDLTKGSVVEWSPISLFDRRFLPAGEHHENPALHHIFTMTQQPGREMGYAWGLLSLYNHSATPNIEMIDGPIPDAMSAVALRDIAAGEELCFDYGLVWFDVDPKVG